MSMRNIVTTGMVILMATCLVPFISDAGQAGVVHDTDAVSRLISIGKTDNRVMRHLDHLTNDIGSRPVGSMNFLKACKWAHDEFKRFGLENVRLEQCGEIKGMLPDDGTSAFFEQFVSPAFRAKADGEMAPIFNVVADITGSALPDEYVIVGAHLDSAPQGPGAADNGAGVAAVMEAARMLAVSDVKPRRTIRFVLFGGEEAGLVGSKGYIETHEEIIPKVSAVYNMDHGFDFISGIIATKPMIEDMRRIFEPVSQLDPSMPFEVKEQEYLPSADPNCCSMLAQQLSDQPGMRRVVNGDGKVASGECGTQGWEVGDRETVVKKVTEEGDTVMMKVIMTGAPGATEDLDLEKLDLKSLGISLDKGKAGAESRVRAIVMGSSDHAPFLAAGIPAFLWVQDENGGVKYSIHSAADTYDKADAPRLEHSATVIALGSLGTANLDHMLSREKLAAPGNAPAKGIEIQGNGACNDKTDD